MGTKTEPKENTSNDTSEEVKIATKTLLNFEREKEEMKRRAHNVIVSGLPSSPNVEDIDLFGNFCRNNLTVKPRVVAVRRLDRDNKNPNAKLCITLENMETVKDVVSSFRLLRAPHKTPKSGKCISIMISLVCSLKRRTLAGRPNALLELRRIPQQLSLFHNRPLTRKWMLTNIRSYKNKFNEVLLFLSLEDPDIFCLTETWLTKDVPDSMLCPSGFNVVRRDRDSRGGGVLLLIRDCISFRSVEIL